LEALSIVARNALKLNDVVSVKITKIKSATKPRKNVEKIGPSVTVKEDDGQTTVENVEKP
jgi:hypothetical protein